MSIKNFELITNNSFKKWFKLENELNYRLSNDYNNIIDSCDNVLSGIFSYSNKTVNSPSYLNLTNAELGILISNVYEDDTFGTQIAISMGNKQIWHRCKSNSNEWLDWEELHGFPIQRSVTINEDYVKGSNIKVYTRGNVCTLNGSVSLKNPVPEVNEYMLFSINNVCPTSENIIVSQYKDTELSYGRVLPIIENGERRSNVYFRVPDTETAGTFRFNISFITM